MATFTISDMIDANIPQLALDPTEKPGRGMLHVLKRIVDFDKFATANGISLANSDTYQIFNLEIGTTVIAAGCNVLDTATAAASMDLGFLTDDDDWFVKAQIANVAGPARVQTVTEATPPVYIAAADTAGATGVYGSGQYILTLYGHALLS